MFYVYLIDEGFMVWNNPSSQDFLEASGFDSLAAAKIAASLRGLPFIILQSHLIEVI